MFHTIKPLAAIGLTLLLLAGACDEPERPGTSVTPSRSDAGASDALADADAANASETSDASDPGADATDASDALADADAANASETSDASDAPTDVGATSDLGAPATCNLDGTWRGTWVAGPLGGAPFVWVNVGGSYAVAGGAVSVGGTFTVTDDVMTLSDTGSTPPHVACNAGTGTYALTRSAMCATVAFRALMDPCDNRRLALDGASMTRQ